jgi:hypothetical protein
MTKEKVAALRRTIARLRHKERVTSEEIIRLARSIRRKKEREGLWSHKVLANRSPLTIPNDEILTKNTAQSILDTFDGDLDAYQETFDQQAQSKNGHNR